MSEVVIDGEAISVHPSVAKRIEDLVIDHLNMQFRVAELEHFAQQVYDEAQEQHLVAQAALLLHPLQP